MPRLSSPHWLALACAAIAATTTSPTTHAAPAIWRCGNSYSNHPCDGASLVGASPPEPTAEQRRHADEGTRRDEAAAQRMQHERLRLDAQPRHGAIIGAPQVDAPEPKAGKKSARLKKPDAFVASYATPADPGAPAPKKKKKKAAAKAG